MGEKAVIARWNDYRSGVRRGVRCLPRHLRAGPRQDCKAAEAEAAEIRAGAAYKGAPPAERDSVVSNVFGSGRACHYAPVTLSTVEALLEAAGKRSLSSLDQALVALPAYRAQVEADLRSLALPTSTPGERVFEWRPVTAIAGKRFKTEDEVDQALDKVSRDLKAKSARASRWW